MTQVVSSQGEVRHRVECMQMFQVTLQTHRSVNICFEIELIQSNWLEFNSDQFNRVSFSSVHAGLLRLFSPRDY